MADLWGQIENAISGGSDKWDDGLVGAILLADYFLPTSPAIIGSGGSLIDITSSGASVLQITGVGAGTVDVTASGAGKALIAGVASSVIDITGAAQANLAIAGTGAGTIGERPPRPPNWRLRVQEAALSASRPLASGNRQSMAAQALRLASPAKALLILS